MSDRIPLEFAELATLARETILEVRLVGREPQTLRGGSWMIIGGKVPMLVARGESYSSRFTATRAEIMELAAVGWEWTPCGPGCACNELTSVCWGPVS